MKKFEQSFINEYMAWNLHDDDVKKRGVAEGIKIGIQQGKAVAYFDLIKSGLLSVKDAAIKLGMSEDEVRARL